MLYNHIKSSFVKIVTFVGFILLYSLTIRSYLLLLIYTYKGFTPRLKKIGSHGCQSSPQDILLKEVPQAKFEEMFSHR